MNNFTRLAIMLVLISLVSACGFKMRGAIALPEHLRTMLVLPNQPYDPFQRALRQTLKLNGILLVEQENESDKYAKLTIANQEFSERTTAYGSDGQANQILMKLKITYQFTDAEGKEIVTLQTAEVERELITNPGAVLVTDSERERLKSDMTVEAALQLVRQLSAIP